MFFFRLFRGSIPGRSAVVEQGVGDYVVAPDSECGSGELTEKNTRDGSTEVSNMAQSINAAANEEGLLGVVGEDCTDPADLEKGPRMNQEMHSERDEILSFTDIVQSPAWNTLRKDFDRFCTSLLEEGAWNLDKTDHSAMKAHLQLKLVHSLFPEDGEDWDMLKNCLLQEISSPPSTCQEASSLHKEELKVDQLVDHPLPQDHGDSWTPPSSVSPATERSRSHSPYRVDPQTPPPGLFLQVNPTGLKVTHFKKSAEYLLYTEFSRPSTATTSNRSITVPPDASSTNGEQSDDDCSSVADSFTQSSEDEGMYPSTVPTSAFTSTQTTPERPTSLSNTVIKIQRTTPPSERKAEPSGKFNEDAGYFESIQWPTKSIEPKDHRPTLFDRSPPFHRPPATSKHSRIPRRTQISKHNPSSDSSRTAGGFKPIFDLRKETPSREQIAEHIDFSNVIYIGTRTIGLQRACLQCVLANLPCDKGWACSRCIRHGQGEMCLVQRDLGIQEKMRIGIEQHSYVVLVRRHDECNEIWEKKKNLEKELLEILQERCDKRNWVLPGDRRNMGGFSTRKRFDTRTFEVDDVRGKGWKMNIVVGDELMMPI
jgi:hypothetical protein